MSSVVTNLVMSLEFKPIHCSTMLCQLGWTRIGYVATRFILVSRTAESSAKSGYVVVPERFGQSEARAGRHVESTREKPTFVRSSGNNRCSLLKHLSMNFIHVLHVLYFMYFFDAFLVISLIGKTFDLLFVFIHCVGAGITTIMSIANGTDPYFFRRKMGKTQTMKEEMDAPLFFSRKSRHFFL